MLKKIFKTILVLSICVGISLPTNAAVSVSDGSAFVTKAEFAADLNNLSNRMAQLENSLDAKIDSLVSSYLTRNGIWNGASQILNAMDVSSNTSFVNQNWLTWFNDTRVSSEKTYSNVPMNTFVRTDFKIVDSFDKTGMLFGTFSLNAIGGLYKMTSAGITGGVDNKGSWEKTLQLYYSWYEVDSANSFILINKNMVYDLIFAATGYKTNTSAIGGYPVVGYVLGFVNKGNSLYFSAEFIYNAHNDSNVLTFNKITNTNYTWHYNLVIDNFCIY